nr:hypothetical transcript [Hymenolepis microstoma]
MAIPFSNTQLRVPHGFADLLWCLSREVLRQQPEDILKFGMKYFEKLLCVRQETGEYDIAKLGAISVDRYYNDLSYRSALFFIIGRWNSTTFNILINIKFMTRLGTQSPPIKVLKNQQKISHV